VKRAASWARDPSELIDAYKTSVELFRSYNNPREDFLNRGADGEPKRDPLPDPPPLEIDGTDPLVAWIRRAGGFTLKERSELSVSYVEREVSVIRTTNAEWGNPPHPKASRSSAGRALQPDLLLRTSHGTPAVGEIKVSKKGKQTDRDPLGALVQCLAGVAHLATRNQYHRLLAKFRDAAFRPMPDKGPALDVYLVSHAHSSDPTGFDTLVPDVETISRKLVRDETVAETLRRIVYIDLSVGSGSLQAECLWASDDDAPLPE
jgi:mRNA-degrading endonuclease YafQ of YafQ-DinJ toxin-antitoxin module